MTGLFPTWLSAWTHRSNLCSDEHATYLLFVVSPKPCQNRCLVIVPIKKVFNIVLSIAARLALIKPLSHEALCNELQVKFVNSVLKIKLHDFQTNAQAHSLNSQSSHRSADAAQEMKDPSSTVCDSRSEGMKFQRIGRQSLHVSTVLPIAISCRTVA